MKIKNFAIVLGVLSGLLFGIATPFSKLLLSSLNSFQLSGLLYLGSGIVIIPSLIKKLYKSNNNYNFKNDNYNNKLARNDLNNYKIDNEGSLNKTRENELNNYNNIANDNDLNRDKNRIHSINNIFKSFFKNKNDLNHFNSYLNNENDVNKISTFYKFFKRSFINNNVKLFLILLFGGVLGPLFLMVGLSYTSSSSAAIWLNMELVATALLGVIIFKDHLDKYSIIGLSLTFIAGIIISWSGGFGEIIPIIFICLACFSWGIDNQLTSIVDGYSPEFITFVKGIFGGGINFTIGMFLARSWIPLDILFYALMLGVISYGLSIVFFVSSAQNLGATRSQILFSTAPFWGILLSILIIHEPLNLNIIIAICFLIAGILITNNLVHFHEHKHSKIEHIHLHSHDDDHHNHSHLDIEEIEFIDENNGNKERSDKKHSHKHFHDDIKHKHSHFPDLHHRHDH